MRILHTADIHIGYKTHGVVDPKSGLNSRLGDFERCFRYMVEHAVEEDIDLVLFCGDAYRDMNPSQTDQRIFARCLKPLLDREIPVVMIVGNHDHPYTFGKVNSMEIFSLFSDSIHLFRERESRDIMTKSGPVRIIGLPWPMVHDFRTKQKFASLPKEEQHHRVHEIYSDFILTEVERLRKKQVDYPVILAGHLHVDTAVMTEGSERFTLVTRDPVFSLSLLKRPEFDYVALGHIHKHQELGTGEAPPVVYSGSIERISFAEAEQEKGFVMIDISKNKKLQFHHVPTPARAMVPVEVDVRNEEDPMPLILERIEETSLEGTIVRVVITCRGEQRKLVDMKEVRKALRPAFVIAGINLKIEQETPRSRVPELHRNLSTSEALGMYISHNKRLLPLREKILEAARRLEEEFEEESDNQGSEFSVE